LQVPAITPLPIPTPTQTFLGPSPAFSSVVWAARSPPDRSPPTACSRRKHRLGIGQRPIVDDETFARSRAKVWGKRIDWVGKQDGSIRFRCTVALAFTAALAKIAMSIAFTPRSQNEKRPEYPAAF
jgi:hypothetical protein